jgi:asparagine synthase (glutamine-hydrolysing)
MCGIYGAVSPSGVTLQHHQRLERMSQRLRHRGPDGHGTATVDAAAFGCERLRVIDPTAAGDQPFLACSGKVMLVANGEIYNAPELRKKYSQFPYGSRSDCESILPLYLDRGYAGFAELDGMFAIAIYDGRSKELVLSRDSAGEKPLFYTSDGEGLRFASEVQALLETKPDTGNLDRWAVRDFLTLGYITEPRTMFERIRKVEAGTVIAFRVEGGGRRDFRFWDCEATTAAIDSEGEAETRLASLLENAVRKQLHADVPVGIFASGGVDSSLLAALASDVLGPHRVPTFSIGFSERPYDESPNAEDVARLLGCPHMTVRVDQGNLAGALAYVVERIAEPVADPAILPTHILAQAAREHVTVVLSGEGADELFGGYPTYLGHRAARWFTRLPRPVRSAISRSILALPVSRRGKVPLEYLLKRFVTAASNNLPQRHLAWFGTGLGSDAWQKDFCASYEPPAFPDGRDDAQRAMTFDYRTYLRDNLLTKVDRATMLSSLEARSPYLDREVAEFALSLDPRLKVRGLTTKWLFKRVAATRLPQHVVHQRKRGLSVPIAQWLNGGLKSEVDRLLAPQRIESRGVLRGGAVRQLLNEHREGRANHSRALWAVLVLEYWLERWVSEE